MGAGKCIFSTFHYVFLVISIVLLGVGIYLFSEDRLKLVRHVFPEFPENPASKNFETLFTSIGAFFTACGAFLFFMSIVGYCGAMQKSRCLLALYAGLLALLLVLQIGVFVYVEGWGTTKSEVKRVLKNIPIDQFYHIPDKIDVLEVDDSANGIIIAYTNSSQYVQTGFTDAFNKIMRDEKCCGIINFEDFPVRDKTMPNSSRLQIEECCKFPTTNPSSPCNEVPFTLNNTNEGCFDIIYLNYKHVIFGILGAIAFIQFVALALAINIYRESKDNKDEDWN